VRPVPGRLEIVARKRAEAPNVFVDYAHTPDALAKTLGLLRPLTKGKLWVVFGCGGDRDRGKRPEMGDVAARLADHVVITSDNPRSEDPRSIVEQIKRGISGTTSVTEQLDREVAIHHAIAHAERDDTVLIAGKGHEAFQTIGTESKAFHDPTVAAAYL
jgi:UDP-N-acetylmuramoyl-L-alanyl-D-glutamate--2,6-diaminopimelate ligase